MSKSLHRTDISIQSEHELRLDGFENTSPLDGTWTVQNIHFDRDRVTVEFYSTKALKEKLLWRAQTELLNDLTEEEFLELGQAIKFMRERAQNQCKSCGHHAHAHDYAGCNYELEVCSCLVPFGGTSTGP